MYGKVGEEKKEVFEKCSCMLGRASFVLCVEKVEERGEGVEEGWQLQHHKMQTKTVSKQTRKSWRKRKTPMV